MITNPLLSRIEALIEQESGKRLLILMPTRLSALAARRELGLRRGGLLTTRVESIEWLEHLMNAPVSKLPNSFELGFQLRHEILCGTHSDDSAAGKEARDLYCSPKVISQMTTAITELIESGISPASFRASGGDEQIAVLLESTLNRYPQSGQAPNAIPSSSQPTLDELDFVIPCFAAHRLTPAQLRLLEIVGQTNKLGPFLDEFNREVEAPTEINSQDTSKASNLIEAVLHQATLHFVPDVQTEVQCALSALVAEAERGTRPDRIAILYPVSHPYAGLIRAGLDLAGVRAYGECDQTLAASAGWQYLNLLFGLSESPGVDEDIDRILSLLVVNNNIPADDLENFRALSATGSFANLIKAAGTPNPRLSQTLEAIQVDSNSLEKCSHWVEMSAVCIDCLRSIGTPDRQLETSLRSLESLDNSSPNPRRTDFKFGLDSIGTLKRTSPDKLQQGCFFGTYRSAEAMEFDVVFGLGFQEHLIPSDLHENAFVPDSVRQILGLPTALHQNEKAMETMADVIANAGRVTLSWAETELDGSRQAFPSRFIAAELNRRILNEGLNSSDFFPKTRRVEGIENCIQTSSSVAAIRQLPPFSPAAENACRALNDPSLAQNPPANVSFDTILGEAPLVEWSSFRTTQFEDILECPLRFYYRTILGAEYKEPKASQWVLTPLRRGNFIHEIVRIWAELYQTHAKAGDLAQWIPSQAQPGHPLPPLDLIPAPAPSPAYPKAQSPDSLQESFEILFADAVAAVDQEGSVIEGPAWEAQKETLRDQLLTYVTEESQYLYESGQMPILLEDQLTLSFPVETGRPDGTQEIVIRGRMDRADRLADGSTLVIDYKSGQLPKIGKQGFWQLPIYGQAVRKKLADQAVAISGQYVNPLLQAKAPANDPLLLTEADLCSRIQVAADLMTSGLFAPIPDEDSHGYCQFCDFKLSCPASRETVFDSLEFDPRWVRLQELFLPLEIKEPRKKGSGEPDSEEEAEAVSASAPELNSVSAATSANNEWETAAKTEKADEEARRAAVQNTHLHTFIEAGAGSGKTTTLVARICESILGPDSPVQPRELVAITFTEKAGGELRARIRTQLYSLAEKEPDLARRARAAQALLHLDEARIGTIHSFCLDLLRKYGKEIQLPPLLQPIDAPAFHRQKIAFIKRIRRLSRTAPTNDLWRACYGAGIADKTIIAMAGLIFDASFFFLLDDKELEACNQNPEAARESIWRAMLEIRDFDSQSIAERSKLKKGLNDVIEQITSDKEASVKQALRIKIREGIEVPKRGKPEVLDANEAGIALYDQFQDAIRVYTCSIVEPLLVNLVTQAKKAARTMLFAGLIPFDAQILCAKTLFKQEDTAITAARSIRALFVDEFQDTDPHQAAIFKRLIHCNPDLVAFFVGDPKQSIYSFRGADLETYQQVKKWIGTEGRQAQTLTLNSNFRSRAAILGYVDQVFTKEFEGQLGKYEKLNACRDLPPAPSGPVVRLLPSQGNGSAETKENEAKAVANAILEVCGFGRPYQFRDAAILFASRSQLPVLLDALSKKQIPYRLMVDSEILESQDAADLRAVLRWLANPMDKPALIGALRSRLFGFKLAELPSAMKGGVGPRSPNAKWEELNEICKEKSMVRVVNTIADACQAVETSLNSAEYQDHLNRWKRLLMIASEFDESVGAGLSEFVNYLENLVESGALHKGTAVPEQDHDAVSIYTVQSAKGLEFPIVICCNLGRASKHTDYPWLETSSNPSLSWAISKKTGSENVSSAIMNSSTRVSQEKWRLAYVAATRAEEMLIVSLYRPKPAHSCLATEFCKIHPLATTYSVTEQESAILKSLLTTQSGELVDWDSLRTRHGILTVSPSGLAHHAAANDPDTEEEWRAESKEDSPFALPNANDFGIRFGRAFHQLMQIHPWTDRLSDQVIADVLTQEQLPLESVEKIQNAEAKALAALNPYLRQGSVVRETFVSAKIDAGLLEGYMDLLIEGPEGCIVVDYKTDRAATKADAEVRFDHYRLQAGAYALMLTEAGKKVKEVRFIFVMATYSDNPSDFTSVVQGEDLNNLIKQARQAAALALKP